MSHPVDFTGGLNIGKRQGTRIKDASDFRLIGVPRFNQDQGTLVFVSGLGLPIGNQVDLASGLKFTISGEGNQFSFGLDRSSDGAFIVVTSGAKAYLIPSKDLLF